MQSTVTEQKNDKLQRENGNEVFSMKNFLELGLKDVGGPRIDWRDQVFPDRGKSLYLRARKGNSMAPFQPSYK